MQRLTHHVTGHYLKTLSLLQIRSQKTQADMLRDCGVKVRNDNKTEQYVVTIPKGYVTDMASVPRAIWAFIAPFDVARAAVVHDIMYEKSIHNIKQLTNQPQQKKALQPKKKEKHIARLLMTLS